MGAGTIKNGFLENYLDRHIAEKKIVKGSASFLVTDYESTRLKLPDDAEYDGEESAEEAGDSDEEGYAGPKMSIPNIGIMRGSQGELHEIRPGSGGNKHDPEMAEAVKAALRQAGLLCDKVEPPSSVADLLLNVFDAADENNAGELPHYEVALLLGALLAGMGLELWDIQTLLTAAQENEDGLIQCKPFIQAAPEIIEELRRRRLAYNARGLPGVEISPDAVKHCFGDEASEIAAALMELFDQKVIDEPNCGIFEIAAGDVSVPVATLKSS